MPAKTSRSISSKATNDLRASGAILGGLMMKTYVISNDLVLVNVGKASDKTVAQTIANMTSRGWEISRHDGIRFSMTHPTFA